MYSSSAMEITQAWTHRARFDGTNVPLCFASMMDMASIDHPTRPFKGLEALHPVTKDPMKRISTSSSTSIVTIMRTKSTSSSSQIPHVSIIRRSDEGGTLWNSMVFMWCDGRKATIETMLSRNYAEHMDLSDATATEMEDIVGRGRLEEHMMCCENGKEVAARNMVELELLDLEKAGGIAGLSIQVYRRCTAIFPATPHLDPVSITEKGN